MQFSKIFSTAALVAVAIASPIVERTTPTCGGDQVAKCCDSLDVLGLGLISIPIGIGCLPLLGACSNKQACCSGKTQQIGLINVDLSCTQIL